MKFSKVEKAERRQKQLVRRAEQAKRRRKRNVYLHNVAQHAKASG